MTRTILIPAFTVLLLLGQTGCHRHDGEHGHGDDHGHAHHDDSGKKSAGTDTHGNDAPGSEKAHAHGGEAHGETGEHTAGEHTEGEHTEIDAAAAQGAGIVTDSAGPVRIRQTLLLHGTVVPDPQRVYRLQPRFPGVVTEVRKQIGDRVAAGEVLAVIESNESLQHYELRAPAAGNIVARDVNPGTAVGNEPIFTVVDLTHVWVELASFQHDLTNIRRGQKVTVYDVDKHVSVAGHVNSIAAVGSAASQSMTVRVVLPNANGEWRPGLFVTGEIVLSETPVALAVRRTAVQTMDERPVVFEQTGNRYVARPVELGRRDREWVEIKSGLTAGARYVTNNSYLIKADIEKSAASHDH